MSQCWARGDAQDRAHHDTHGGSHPIAILLKGALLGQQNRFGILDQAVDQGLDCTDINAMLVNKVLPFHDKIIVRGANGIREALSNAF